MKKTIVYLFICLILTASAMTSCKAKIKYSFLNPITNICGIKIVEVGADDGQGINEQTEIMVIEDIKAFLFLLIYKLLFQIPAFRHETAS